MKKIYLPVSAIISLLAWSSWGNPAWALLVVIPWAYCRSAGAVFLSAWVYYLAAMWPLALMTGRFMSLGPAMGLLCGLAVWLVWAGFLGLVQALPAWIVQSRHRRIPRGQAEARSAFVPAAWRPWTVLLGLILVALPPVGWLNTFSPVSAWGEWFPGSGWRGVFLGMAAVWYLANLAASRAAIRLAPVVAIAAVVALTHALEKPTTLQPQWQAVETAFGGFPANTLQEHDRVMTINKHAAEARQQLESNGAKRKQVLVFPEMAIPEWRPRTAYWLEPAIGATADGKLSWIAGAMQIDEATGRPVNGLLVAERGKVRWIDGRVSFPGGMWRPGAGGYLAPRGPAALVEIDGVLASVSICYEDMLPWTNLQSLAALGSQRPAVYVSLASHWFISRERAHRQVASAQSWARLFGVPTLRASNY